MPDSSKTLWFGDQALGLFWDVKYAQFLSFINPSTASHSIALYMTEIAGLLDIFILILLKKLMNENTGKWRQILFSSAEMSTEFTEIFPGVRTKQELLRL